MKDWLSRTENLIGNHALNKIKNSTVAVFGIGGVGSYAAEALVRAGIGKIVLIDNDEIDNTNINRQLIADTTVIGKSKVEVARERYLKINPNLKIEIFKTYYESGAAEKLILSDYDYIVDAIDSVTSKISLIEQAKQKNIQIISSMGTGNKLDPTRFEVTDITKTSVCPLAKVIRKELRIRGINHLKVVYSKEEIQNRGDNKRIPASISFVPSVVGLIMAGEVIKDLIKRGNKWKED
ncbi:MAG: tRNA threonylcarbamoyladenosine dehydratase [Clostridia bacterium]|nr:tRNA threonylcarbamoyladenosine dehydratase [Clostridia bacterium]